MVQNRGINQINFTDSESRIMKDPTGEFIQGYDGQCVVDTASKVIKNR